ncbi:CPBP family intramembrane glutamic endopeptidase [Natrarchaeobaculum aegyptiacum]|uniref:Abortive infection protein n=1 Tax=Natrarchaeobaculum aegyptiacum TaxID=745377 RepID=A0A2Z2HVN0_9EURY|nr:type II CAAX endopeptidase family protein [Natrarchaeobaculum aegyptiacum]ARS89094.1 Abortive infection protein [Natrarchaeobaculum aegyptiacum]
MHDRQASSERRRSLADRLRYGSTDGRLRATWRLLAALLVGFVIYIGGHLFVPAVVADALGSVDGVSAVGATVVIFVGFVVTIAIATGASLLVASRLDRRPLTSYGFALSRRWYVDFVAGVLIGVVASIGTVSYQALRGQVSLSVTVTGVGVDSALLGGVVLVAMLAFLLAGNVFEEVLFRSIFITTVAEGLRSRSVGAGTAVVAGVLASLPVFGVFHVLGGGIGLIVTSAIGGVLFAVAYVLTGQLGLPIGVHFGGVAIVSIGQEPISAEPALTLPSILVAEQATTPSLATGVETWTVRMLIGVALVCAWVYLVYGDLSVTDRLYREDAGY